MTKPIEIKESPFYKCSERVMTMGYSYLRQVGVIPRHEGSPEVLFMFISINLLPGLKAIQNCFLTLLT